MNIFNKLTLKAKLIMMCVGISLCVSGLNQYLFSRFEKQIHDNIRENLGSQSDSLANAISAQFFERYADVQAFATNEIMQVGTSETIAEALNKYVPMYSIYDLIIVTDMKGNLVAVNKIGANGKPIKYQELNSMNFADTVWFKAVTSGAYTEDKENGFSGTFVENPALDELASKVYGENRYTNGFSTIIRNKKDQPIGVISNRANLNWVESQFKDLYKELKTQGFENSHLYLLASNGIPYVDYHPSGNNNSSDIVHNFSYLTKKKLTAEDLAPIANLQSKTNGVIEYKSKDGEQHVASFRKLGGSKFISSLDWNVVVLNQAEDAFETLDTARRNMIIAGLTFAILFSIGSWMFSSRVSNSIMNIANSMAKGADETAGASRMIADSSAALSTTATEQASSLQQTVTAIDEISAMIGKTADSAGRSQTSARESQSAIQEGQKAVIDVIQSMEEIKRSNQGIVSQINQNAKEMQEIVQVISDIGNKTKVINDIVFQTKLLSFNASVEAARAGEHGKGFAVVAEEVGNLAQMSGNASKEISNMLESSVQKVNTIASGTKVNVEKLFREIEVVIARADSNAQNCGQSFDKVMKGATEVFEMLNEISTASTEQNIGVQEINKMMNQLDIVTQQTTGASHQTASAAEELNAQSDSLLHLASTLQALLDPNSTGQSKDSSNSPKPPKSAVRPSSAQRTKADTQHAKKPKIENVIQMTKATNVPRKSNPVEATLKTAMGQSHELPTADDSRFEDI